MNSVHLVTQEKYRVEPGQKQAECTECTAQSQLARLSRPATRAPATRTPVTRFLPAPRALCAAATPLPRTSAALRAPLRTPTPQRLRASTACEPQHSACAPQRSACPPSRAPQPSCLVFGHNTPRCIATQSLLANCPSQVTIQNCIVTQFLSKPSSYTAI